MQDNDEDVREIKREIIESRSLVIKTNNLTSALAADVKSIAKRQANFERRAAINGAVAYAIFATISFVGLKLWSDVRIREIEGEMGDLRRDAEDLHRELDVERGRARVRHDAETRAAELYQLVREQKRRETLERWEAIRREPGLTRTEQATFEDAVQRFRGELSLEAYVAGLEQMRTGRYVEASESFRESLELGPDGTHAPATHLVLARALLRVGRAAEAQLEANSALNQELDRDIHDDALSVIAECAVALNNLDDARAALRTIMRRWPRADAALTARDRLRELAHHP